MSDPHGVAILVIPLILIWGTVLGIWLAHLVKWIDPELKP
jgi:uncharacterized protein YneF (UPF0154 family)